ncbi:T9SS type A sorting domain-containing protein [Mesonia sp.]|uniref:T9SS type A sorting domain-containing protein n=1 Tax=Mesonia sp. TaxID=1960830 RepID=UPI003F9D9FCB
MKAITIDDNDNLYVLGTTASTSNIATPNSFQESFGGVRDVFIAKMSPSGILNWSTYYGNEIAEGVDNARHSFYLTFDDNNAIYVIFRASGSNLASSGAFQTVPIPENITSNNAGSSILAKFDLEGNRLWATYYGIHHLYSVKANADYVYVAGNTLDCPPQGSYNTYYGTPNAYMPEPASCRDVILTQFNTDGERLWSTYYGGSSNGDGLTGKRVLDVKADKVFLTGIAVNYINQEIATAGTYQPHTNGLSPFIVLFNSDGTRNWGTYNGLDIDNTAGGGWRTNVLSEKGNSTAFYTYGVTSLMNNIATSNGYQAEKNVGKDAFVSRFRNETGKSWGTYYGGEGEERYIDFHPYADGTKFYIVGDTQSLTQIASENGLQPTKQVFSTDYGSMQDEYTLFAAHFEPMLAVDEVANQHNFTLYPNPAEDELHIEFNKASFDKASLEIVDILGKKIHAQMLSTKQTKINIESFEAGTYFVRITMNEETSVSKILVK